MRASCLCCCAPSCPTPSCPTARLPRCAEEFFAAGQAYVALSRVRSLDLGVVTDADLAADGAWRFAPTGSASLQLDAHTHQQEQAEIERLEGSA